MNKIIPLIFLTFIITFSSCSDRNNLCIITGTVINPQDDSIILFKPNEDPYHDSIIEIPIIDGKFRYELAMDVPVGYDLMYGKDGQPGGNYMAVFLEKGHIELKIYPENEWDKNTVKGGKVNEEFESFKKIKDDKFTYKFTQLNNRRSVLQEDNNYFSEEMKILREERVHANPEELLIIKSKINNLRKTKTILTEPAKKMEDEWSEIYEEQRAWQKNYISENTNIVSYYLLLTELSYSPERINIKIAEENYKKLKTKFPNHPYNKSAEFKLSSLKNIEVGRQFVDFSLPDLNGNIVKLSDEIKGKIALIDLWASWCSPCIVNSRAIVPIYEEFKDKGFTVVGVAGEFKNTENLEKRLEQEKFPWLNLVELDREKSIWEIYGVARAGGGVILVDKDGKILAIDPTPKEVRDMLVKLTE